MYQTTLKASSEAYIILDWYYWRNVETKILKAQKLFHKKKLHHWHNAFVCISNWRIKAGKLKRWNEESQGKHLHAGQDLKAVDYAWKKNDKFYNSLNRSNYWIKNLSYFPNVGMSTSTYYSTYLLINTNIHTMHQINFY